MTFSFTNIVYEDSHNCVSWSGIECIEDEQFSEFLTAKVSERLDDSTESEEFRRFLNGLPLTGLGQENLAAVLNAEQPEERAWAAGEALAEAFLEEDQNVVFPWNMERDKRNPFGSLPGADIVGFIGEGRECRFALGEVKTSSEQQCPPQVMSGRSGHIGHQLDQLSDNLTIICQLLKWLLIRINNTQYQNNFKQAAVTFFNSGNKDIALFGILIRDTEANSRDISVRGRALRGKFSNPTTCNLIALYLPWGINQLINKIRNGGAS
ncbi:MAG: hypothetical protein P9M05_02345 [Candidatus Stygibacter australis]|nr:hypothetical protein [Candidatus Stygibacter australis]